MMPQLRAWIERFFHSRVSECVVLRVIATRRLTPHMLRVSFAGQDLDAFATDENLHVKLLLPPEGASRAHWLAAGRDGKARLKGKDCDPVFRKYTIRAIDADAGRVDIDFVSHDDGGPGASWAAAAKPGDVVGMIGPGGRGLSPADWYLIAGDETALPAIGRMIETLPADARGCVMVEVADRHEEQPLALPSGMTFTWLYRNGASSGTTALLPSAVRAVNWPGDGGAVFVWIAAEFATTQVIRRHLRDERGLTKNEQLVVAYWRQGTAAAT